jgi:hypothetical protein
MGGIERRGVLLGPSDPVPVWLRRPLVGAIADKRDRLTRAYRSGLDRVESKSLERPHRFIRGALGVGEK